MDARSKLDDYEAVLHRTHSEQMKSFFARLALLALSLSLSGMIAYQLTDHEAKNPPPPPPSPLQSFHDDARGVTCWTIRLSAPSCLPDSVLTPKAER